MKTTPACDGDLSGLSRLDFPCRCLTLQMCQTHQTVAPRSRTFADARPFEASKLWWAAHGRDAPRAKEQGGWQSYPALLYPARCPNCWTGGWYDLVCPCFHSPATVCLLLRKHLRRRKGASESAVAAPGRSLSSLAGTQRAACTSAVLVWCWFGPG